MRIRTIVARFIDEDYAPIVLIAFNRSEHLKRTLISLAQNVCAKESSLYCYIDGAKTSEDAKKQDTILEVIDGHRPDFKKISVIHREKNYGLARNITEAVTEVVCKYGKVIVVEDDIVTSRAFLEFMNDALNFYKNEGRVWHIAAHSEVDAYDKKDEIFLWRVMNCWGWATWHDRWLHYHKDAEQLIEEFTEQMVSDFDLNGSGVFWSQVLANSSKKIDTWAIFWYATIFKNNGVCVNPYFSHAANIGFDGTGVHCGVDNKRIGYRPLNHLGKFNGKVKIIEDSDAVSVMRKAYFPKKNGRYYLLKVVTLFVSKEILKRLLKRG